MGRPQAIVIGVDQYRDILEELETIEDLQDKEYLMGVAEAREDIKLGRILTLAELDQESGFAEDEIIDQP